MAKIRFLSAGDDDGCTFYRCIEPARVLRERGHDATSSRTIGLGEAASADVVVFARSSEAPAVALMKQLLAMTSHRPKIVYEIDDDLLNLPTHQVIAHDHYANQARRDRITFLAQHADVFTAPTAHLVDQFNKDVGTLREGTEAFVVPNYVPERFVVDKVPERAGPPVIGWAGSYTHRLDFEQVILPLRRALRETDASVHLIGADYTGRIRAAAHVPAPEEFGGPAPWVAAVQAAAARTRFTPWTEGVPAYLEQLDFTIGLAPLVDDLFNRSKSDIKLKEYAARGIAPIASDVGPYADSSVPRLGVYEGATWGNWLVDEGGVRPEVTEDALRWAKRNTLELHAEAWEMALLS